MPNSTLLRYALFSIFFVCPLLSFSQSIIPEKIDALVLSRMPEAIKEHRSFVLLANDAQYPEDMLKNVAWMEKAFANRGMETQVLDAGPIPVFLAQLEVDPEKPTVLFYFHYDGQPVDPSKWNQADPFVPILKEQRRNGDWKAIDYQEAEHRFNPEWRVYARAAADDKGPIMMFLQALDIMQEAGLKPAYNIKVLLDGEEEKGSAGLLSTLEKYKDLYAADRLIIMDGPAHPTNRPTLTFGCRGIASATLTVYGAKLPQHSGHFGNYAPNPVFKMSHLLASMKDEEGRVLIEGFYDGIELDQTTRKILAGVPDDATAINARLGVAMPEQVGANYQEALQYPSLNVRGMASAWIGKQTRTIVPDEATAQLGVRLVPESDGDRLLALIRKHIRDQGYYLTDRAPTDEERLQHPKIASFVGKKSVNAFRTDLASPTGKWLAKALEKVHGQEPIRIRIMGGTVPITPLIEALNMPAIIVPMVNMDNNQHSPNENLRMGNFYDGIKTCVGILGEEF